MQLGNLKRKWDRPLYGVVVGIVASLIGFLISWPVKCGECSLDGYWNMIYYYGNNGSEIMSFCLLGNLLFFYLFFFQLKWNEISKGLIVTTVVFLIYILLVD